MTERVHWGFKPPKLTMWRTEGGMKIYEVVFVSVGRLSWDEYRVCMALTKPTPQLRALVANPMTVNELMQATKAAPFQEVAAR